MTFDRLKNRIDAINKVHAYINEHAPYFIDHIKKNGYKMKSGTNELFKKDRESLEALMGDKNGLQVWVYSSCYNQLAIYVKTSYAEFAPDSNGCSVTSYYEQSLYLSGEREFSNLPIYNLKEWRSKAELIEPLREEISKLEDQLRTITYIVNGR